MTRASGATWGMASAIPCRARNAQSGAPLPPCGGPAVVGGAGWVGGGGPGGCFAGLRRGGFLVGGGGGALRVGGSRPAGRHRWGGGNDCTPSLPAVGGPRWSWVTRRPANSRAYQDVLNRLWRVCPVRTSPCCVAGDRRVWRRKPCRATCFQGMACQATSRRAGSCVVARHLGRTPFPFRTPARRQPIRGVPPGFGFCGPPLLPEHVVGTDSVR